MSCPFKKEIPSHSETQLKNIEVDVETDDPGTFILVETDRITKAWYKCDVTKSKCVGEDKCPIMKK